MPNVIETTVLHQQASRVALRVSHHSRMEAQDCEDIRQDLLLDLLSRLHAFDRKRGTLGAFASVCFAHRAGWLLRRARREHAYRHPVSLDTPLAGREGVTVGDTLSEADGYSSLFGQVTDAAAASERRLDLERALGGLPEDRLPLCAALTDQTPHELVVAGYGPRTSIYRQIRAIHLDLLVAGIGPSWNGSASARVEV